MKQTQATRAVLFREFCISRKELALRAEEMLAGKQQIFALQETVSFERVKVIIA